MLNARPDCSPSGNWLAIGTNDAAIILYDLHTLKVVNRKLNAHE